MNVYVDINMVPCVESLILKVAQFSKYFTNNSNFFTFCELMKTKEGTPEGADDLSGRGLVYTNGSVVEEPLTCQSAFPGSFTRASPNRVTVRRSKRRIVR